MEPHPATILHAHVATVSTLGYVGCPQQGQWATEKCAGAGGGGECRREVLWVSALLHRCTGALTKRLPLEVIEVRLKAGWVLLCGTGNGGNRLYFDCQPVLFASTSHIARFSMTPLDPSKVGSLTEQIQSSSTYGCFVAGVHTPMHAMVHGREVQSAQFHCGAPMGAGCVAANHLWCTPCAWDRGIGLYAGLLGLWGGGG